MKKIVYLLFALSFFSHAQITTNTSNQVWSQIGADIDGEAGGDNSGQSVSLSADGQIMAIGADVNDGVNGSNSGHVRVYKNNNGTWTQLGDDIDGEAADDQSGRSVSLSADGSIVAIGAYKNDGKGSNSGHVRVLQFNTTTSSWDQLGIDIDGESAVDESGFSVSLSDDGSVVAIGAYGNDGSGTDSGHVRVFQFNNNNWDQLGDDIDGEAARDQSGNSVSLSADGSVVAIGAIYNDGKGSNSGHVRVLQFNTTTSSWDQLGDDIDGEAAGDNSGSSVSLSADGSIVAIGARINDGNGGSSGHVRVFQFNNNNWDQLGDDIDGEADGDYFGRPVRLSADGQIMAIGAIFNDGNGTDSGHVRVFQYNNNNWTQLGSDIDGEALLNWSGSSVSLSADGSVVAIGAIYNDGNGIDSGHVRVYNLVIPSPEFTSSASAVTIEETATSVTVLDANATDGAGGTVNDANVTFALSGTDTADFSIESATGEISFAAVPNWSSPADANTDNIYEFIVTATNTTTTGTIDQHVKIFVYPKNSVTGNEDVQQLGADIDGEAAEDSSGQSVSLSADGQIMAIGAVGNDGNGSNSGHVRIYKNNNGTWTQLGADIDGEAAGDQSGSSVSLSADGSIVAIGASGNDGNGNDSGHVRVYKNTNSIWTQLGADIDGEAAEDRSGGSVSLSADGSIVAIGATLNDGNGDNSGHVRVYENNNGTWTKLGADIDGEVAEDNSGWSVSLSADGQIMAIGAIGNDGNGNRSGHVRVHINNNGTWSQLGADIDGEAVNDLSGRSVGLSANGSIVAIGASSNDANGNNSGHVRVYKNNNDTWTQLGDDIDGEAADDFSGRSVSLSADGSLVAIGATLNDSNGIDYGHIRVYKNNNDTWTQIGVDIDGEAAEDRSGRSVSLSADGSVVAIGAIQNDGNGNDSGHVRVYNLGTSTASIEDSFVTKSIVLYPNPVKDQLFIEVDAGIEIKEIRFYDIIGKRIKFIKGPQSSIYLAGLPKGVYHIKFKTNIGTGVKRIVKE